MADKKTGRIPNGMRGKGVMFFFYRAIIPDGIALVLSTGYRRSENKCYK
jgi:hypothetical protein